MRSFMPNLFSTVTVLFRAGGNLWNDSCGHRDALELHPKTEQKVLDFDCILLGVKSIFQLDGTKYDQNTFLAQRF